MDTGRTAVRGGAATIIAQAIRMCIAFAGLVILSRVLSPEDFGLVAIVMSMVSIGELVRDFGISSAAIQTKNLTVELRNNLFWINTTIGFLLFIAGFAMAVPVAGLFRRPELVDVTRWMAIIFLINGVQAQYQVSLVRAFRFKALAVSDVLSQALGLTIAVVVALQGAGYWSLVAQYLIAASSLLVLRAILVGWRPGLYTRTVPIAELVRYGANLSVAQIINYLAGNADTFILGMRSTSTELGFYNRAFQILMAPINQLLVPLTNVALPILSQIQVDRARYNSYLRAAQRLMGIVGALLFGFFFGAAKPIVTVALGPQWEPTASILAILSLGGVFQVLSFNGYWVFLSLAKTRALVLYNMCTKGLLVFCIMLGSVWGAVGVAGGYAIALMASWPICLIWLNRIAALPFWSFFRTGMACVALTVVCGGCIRIACDFGVNLSYGMQIVCAVGVLLFFILSIGLIRLGEVKGLLRTMRRGR